MKKPIKSTAHGTIDYIFAAVHFFVPPAIGLSKEATDMYAATGAAITINDAITDTAAGIVPALTLKEHQIADALLLAGMTAMTATPPIRNERKALIFHLAVLTTSYLYFALSDYNSRSERSF